jgi:glyoxylase-like metal-dependent hydrolase (beta-lactamase superfamily II)
MVRRTLMLLTPSQLKSLREHPNDPCVKLDTTGARSYLVVDYDPVLPIAPGVVLVKTPGHTPGSHVVYVRLKCGQEILLAGDGAWNMAGIATLQRPGAGA